MLPEPLTEPDKDLWDFHDETSLMGFTALSERARLGTKLGT
jgi:hypothetical protein